MKLRARLCLAGLVLATAGCAAPPVAQELSVWWAPLATYDERQVLPETLTERLSERCIQCVVHPKSQGVSVAFERHAEAAAHLKAAPFAPHLKFHEIQGGPRPGASLRRTSPDSTRNNWIEVARYRGRTVDATALLQFLQKSQSEVGIVIYGTDPEWSSVTVPEFHAVRARQSLRASPYRKTVEILW